MKKLISIVVFLLGIVANAGAQQTPNIGLRVPVFNAKNWNVPLNYNFTLLDEIIAGQQQFAFVGLQYRPIFSATAPNNGNCSSNNNGQEYFYNNGLGITVYACQASSSSWIIIGFQNPMTTTGDMIYSSNSAGNATRLGIGANGQVLTVVGGVPQWQTSSATFPYPAAGIPTSTGTAWGSSYSTIGGGIYLPLVPALGSTGQILTINSSGNLDWEGSGGITYPGAGIVTSTGSAFGTSYGTTGGGTLVPLVPTLGSNGQYLGINAGVLQWLNSPGFANPMTSAGDLIYGGSGGAATRLAAGSNGQVLTLSGGLPVWAANSGLSNPMTSIGDMIVGTDSSGTPGRLAAGTSGYVLTTNGTGALPSWQAGFTNPMTTTGDLITGGSTGTPTRLGIGTSGYVLQSNGTGPVWAANTSLTNPMTTAGDIIYGGSGGAPTRLGAARGWLYNTSTAPAYEAVSSAACTTSAQFCHPTNSNSTFGVVFDSDTQYTTLGDLVYYKGSTSGFQRVGIGTTGQVLTVSGGVPAWSAPSFSNPMTTVGDIIYGAASGAPTRLAAGTSGQCLLSNGAAAPVWGACGGGGGGSITNFFLSADSSVSNASASPGTNIGLSITLPTVATATWHAGHCNLVFLANTTSATTFLYMVQSALATNGNVSGWYAQSGGTTATIAIGSFASTLNTEIFGTSLNANTFSADLDFTVEEPANQTATLTFYSYTSSSIYTTTYKAGSNCVLYY